MLREPRAFEAPRAASGTTWRRTSQNSLGPNPSHHMGRNLPMLVSGDGKQFSSRRSRSVVQTDEIRVSRARAGRVFFGRIAGASRPSKTAPQRVALEPKQPRSVNSPDGRTRVLLPFQSRPARVRADFCLPGRFQQSGAGPKSVGERSELKRVSPCSRMSSPVRCATAVDVGSAPVQPGRGASRRSRTSCRSHTHRGS